MPDNGQSTANSVAGSGRGVLSRHNACVPGAVEIDTRLEELLERATEFFEGYLWESRSSRGARAGLKRRGLEEQVLRDFGLGYAPIGPSELVGHLQRHEFSSEELMLAGLATKSRRGHVHAYFRSRVMFPIRDREGRILGFAGLATHLGPSWPLWITSPDSGRYRRSEAVFGLDQAAAAISRSGRAVVLPDCLEVLAAHQRREHETVAVHTSELTPEQTERLASEVPGGVDELEVIVAEDDPRRRPLPRPLRAEPAQPTAEAATAEEMDPAPDLSRRPTRRERVGVVVASAMIGLGVPLGWQLAIDPAPRPPGGTSDDLGVMLVAVAVSYLVLAVLVALVSAHARTRWTGRRMRLRWLIGLTEWQPRGWTYHLLERILLVAAVLSTIVCLVWWSTIGGFFG